MLFAHHVPTPAVYMIDVSMEESSTLSHANLIAPDTEEDFLPKSIPDKNNISTLPEKQALIGRWKVGELDKWAKTTLSVPMRTALLDSTGKRNHDTTFEGELVFRHALPYVLLHSAFFTEADINNLDKATPLPVIFLNLLRRYANVDTSPVRGYDMYKNFKTETNFHKERIHLSSAALFQSGFHVEDTVRYIGGPHIGAHRNPDAIRKRLTAGVEPATLDRVISQFVYGAPKKVHGVSSNANFMEYFKYGNHSSCDIHKDKFKEVMLKDSRQGNTMLVDLRLLLFIPHLHLTPQGLVDVDNQWKSDRPVFDSSFRPEIWCNAINDWVDKTTEGQVYFPGSFTRLLSSIWNMRITYPNEPIFIGDDDVKNAFRLIKNNPAVVGMHGFVGHGLLGFSTGMTFGDNYSPQNFEPIAVARSQQSKYLW